MLQRTLSAALPEKFFKGKAIMLLGARQVGKKTINEA